MRLIQAVNRADVGVIERRQNLRFPAEAGKPIRIVRERLGQEFQGDLAVECRVVCAVDNPHTAGTKLRFDLIMADELATREC